MNEWRYILAIAGYKALEKLLDLWVKYSKSTKNKWDDFLSLLFYDIFQKIKSVFNIKKKNKG